MRKTFLVFTGLFSLLILLVVPRASDVTAAPAFKSPAQLSFRISTSGVLPPWAESLDVRDEQSGSPTDQVIRSDVAQDDPLGHVEPLVLDELAATGRTDFFIWMQEKADLSPAYGLETKEKKGRFVYETLRATAERTQKGLRAQLDREGVDYHPFYVANKILVRGGCQTLLMDVVSRPDVARITANHRHQLKEPIIVPRLTTKTTAAEPNIIFVNADQVWASGYTGEGTVLAGNDTGVDWDHPALINQYRGWDGTTVDHNYSWWDATGTYPTAPSDGDGHGTHTSGTIVGDDGGGNRIGVAPGARLVHCKCLDDSGSGSDATATECFQWDLAPWDLDGLDPRPELAPDAINISWGYAAGGSSAFEDEIAALRAAGIVVAVSAGNEGPNCRTLSSPGDCSQSLTAGSVSHTGGSLPGALSGFSSRGPSSLYPTDYIPDVMAPGEDIRSSTPGGGYEDGWSGTSMAVPHVTGLVGLMWSANPGLRGMVRETLDIINDTAVPLTGQTGSGCGGDYVEGPNTDWGHGTVDALAAVEQGMHFGGIGYLVGTVTDGVDPVPDAIVEASLTPTMTWRTTSDSFGDYSMTIFSGTHTVDAHAYGYFPREFADVSVVSGATTTLDIVLTPSEYHVVSGAVTDAETGWPLYASIEIEGYPGDPIWSDPVTGEYSISLSENVSYTFSVEAWVDGYYVSRLDVGPLTEDEVHDFQLQVDVGACAAPGHHLNRTLLLSQDFDAGIPSSWTVTDNLGSGCVWRDDDPGERGNLTGGSGSFAIADSDVCDPMDTGLRTPAFDATSYTGLQIEYKNDYNDLGSTAQVDVYDGDVWTTVDDMSGVSDRGPETRVLNTTTGAGLANARIGWHYVAGWDWWWEVDEIRVYGTTCTPQPGGLVVGNVFDERTDESLAGAEVRREDGFLTTSEATPDDPAVLDGFYTIFSPQGSKTFTSTIRSYGRDVDSVTVLQGKTIEHDFHLPAGWLTYAPSAVESALDIGTKETASFTLTNRGGVEAAFALQEEDRGFAPLSLVAGRGQWLHRSTEGVLLPTNDGGTALAHPSAYRWEPAQPCQLSILIYADDPVHRAPNTFLDQALQTLGLAYTAHYNGDFAGFHSDLTTGGPWDLVLVGHDDYGGLDAYFTALDGYVKGGGKLTINTWEMGDRPSHPLWTTMGATYLGDDSDPPDPVYWWEPSHPVFNDPAVVPEFVSLMGGIYRTYGQRVEPRFGVDALAGYTTPGPDPDEAALILGNDGRTVLKGFLDGQNSADLDGDATPDGVELWMNLIIGQLRGFSRDVPWLVEDPNSGTLAAGTGIEVVEVTFDASVPEVTQPGQYWAQLTVDDDTPYETDAIPVTMTVNAPTTWGKLGGTITGLGYCDAEPSPLEGAEVLVESWMTETITVTHPITIALEDFEADEGGYTVVGETSWAWGTPVSGPGSAHSGSSLWATNLSGDYENDEDGYVQSPDIDLSACAGQSPELTWWQYYDGENCCDHISVEVSNDGGATWSSPVYGPSDGGDVNERVWEQQKVSIDPSYAVASFRVRFRFSSDFSVTYPGWYIDDVSVIGYEESQIDVPVSWQLESDAVGGCQRWIDEAYSPLTVTVTYPDHMVGHVTGVSVIGQATTTQDFDLRWLQPCVDVAPASISATLDIGTTAALPMTISNSGAAGLLFDLQEQDRGLDIATATERSDPFGYAYKDSNDPDGPVYDFVDISRSGAPVSLGDDDAAGPFDLGFVVDFYGTGWSQYYISSNGYLSFGGGSPDYGNDCPLPSVNLPDNVIAMHWDDLNPSAGGSVYRQSFESCPYGAGRCAVVMFDNVPHYGGSSAGVFEVILFENGSVLMQYQDPGVEVGSGATTGIENNDGTMGLTYETCNSAYLSADLAVCFAYPGNAPDCSREDVPWLLEQPISGTVAPDDGLVSVDVIMDPALVAQPGEYYAALHANTNDPYSDTVRVPVTMTVNVPATWGKLEGTVQGLGHCDTSPAPLEDAQVLIANGDAITTTTDISGTYAYWLDASTYTVTVSAGGHVSNAFVVTVTAQMTTSNDVSLRWARPCVSVEPLSKEVSLMTGCSSTFPLTLTNSGAVPTTFEFDERDSHLPSLLATPRAASQVTVIDEEKRKAPELAGVSPTGSGGPDLFGYTYVDSNEPGGPDFEWIEIAPPMGGDGTPVGLSGVDDGHVFPIAMPFPFSFYGADYRDLVLGSNGVVYFDSDYLGFQNTSIPSTNSYGIDAFIAHFWDDLVVEGDVYYQDFGDVFVVEYYNVRLYGGTTLGIWEVVLYDNGNILFQYLDTAIGDGSGATFGIQGNVVTGSQYSYNASAVTDGLAVCFVYPGEPLCGELGDVPWLSPDPGAGRVLADGGLMSIDVTLDAAQVPHPGQYSATLDIKSDDPVNPRIGVAVTMTVVQAPQKLFYLPITLRNH